MSQLPSAGAPASNESNRIWTQHVTGDLTVAEYDDGETVIENNERGRSWNSVLLERHQIRNLLEFARTAAETILVIPLGEDSVGDEVAVSALTAPTRGAQPVVYR